MLIYKRLCEFILLYLTTLPLCLATTCLVCSSLISNEDCNSKGVVRQCRSYEVCMNKVTSYNSRTVITKRCTPRRTCRDRCRRDKKGKVAVCNKCCKSDKCNGRLLVAPTLISKPGSSARKESKGAGKGSPTKCTGLYIRYVAKRCVRLKSQSSVGTTCLFWCSRREHTLIGPSRLTCLDTAKGPSWSGTPPTCRRKTAGGNYHTPGSCSSLEYDEGTTNMDCTNEFNFKSACTFRCKDGYYMVEKDNDIEIDSGERKSVCWRGTNTPVVWTKSVPRCLQERCPILVRNKYSNVYCDNWIRVGSVCDFSCMAGFYQVGPRFVSCIDLDPDDKEKPSWNNTVPRCEPRECPVMNLPGEKISKNCTNEDFFRSQCSFRCAKGHYMTESVTYNALPENSYMSKCAVTKTDDMVWTPLPPSCFIKMCPRIGIILDAEVICTDDNRFMSICTITCSDAFLITGEEKLTCVEKERDNSPIGKWDSEVPWCRPKVCEPLEYDISNTDLSCTDGVKYGTVCTFTCKVGYFMTTPDALSLITTGNLKTECVISPQRTIVWTDIPPMCHLKTCEELSHPANGVVSCTDENNHASVCSFSCSAGYILRGRKSIRCEDTGTHIPKQTWSHEPPGCKAKPCPTLEYDAPTTNMNCTLGGLFGSICTFTCKTGYYMPSSSGRVLSNSASICILNDGSELEWNTPAPDCLLKICPTLSDPEFGNVKCSNDAMYNSLCRFTCDPGYESDKGSNLRCIDDGYNRKEGIWDNEIPICIRRSCLDFNLNIDAIGVVCEPDLKFLSECEFHCMEGHYMTRGKAIVNSATTTCGVEKNRMTWSEDPPSCNLKSCEKISELKRGLLRCSKDALFDSTCLFMCTPGFYLLGERAIRCQDNGINNPLGSWSHEAPTCERKSCDKQTGNSSVYLTELCSNGYYFESECNYSCDPGYYMSDLREVTAINKIQLKCGVTGRDMTWSSPLPECSLKTCLEYRNPVFGNSTCEVGHDFASTCIFTCERGYDLEGSMSMTCEDSKVNSPNGIWSDVPPVCEPRLCDVINFDPEVISMACTRAQEFKSVCEFSCDLGYYTIGEENEDFLARPNATCGVDDGNDMIWSRKPPKCQVKLCENHKEFENGRISCSDGVTYKSKCTFECLPGFELVGESESTCFDADRFSKSGNWSSDAPVCEPRPCPELVYNKDTTTVDCLADDKYRSVCSFGCFHGYYMTSRNDKQIVDVATTRCDVKSNDMFWTEASPVCMLKSCPDAKVPADGRVDCTDGINFKSECLFSCSIVRKIKGNETLTCDADDKNIPLGLWNEPFPTCELRSCPDWNIDTRAIGETCKNEYKYGSDCTFSCNEGFYTPVENKTNGEEFTEAECRIDGTVMTWIGEPPVCEIKTCSPLNYPGNGTYDCTDFLNYDTVCGFSCIRGFLLIGTTLFKCRDDGTDGPDGIWDAVEEPVCEPRSCKELVYDYDTQDVECSFGVKYGSVCQIKCKEGYYMTANNGIDLLDNASATCDVHPTNRRDVLWDHDEPKCFIKTCLKLTPPADGNVLCENGITFGSKCVYECLPGFQLVGLSTRSCKEDERNIPTGIWSKETPVCEPKSCSRLVNNDNSTNFECTNGWIYRSVCTFTCNKGFFITRGDGRTVVKSGKTKTRCGRGTGEGMAWSNQVPTCLSKYCLAIRPRKNMTISCTDKFKFSSKCTFACDTPLTLVGPPVLNCLDDVKSPFSGKWNKKHWGLKCTK